MTTAATAWAPPDLTGFDWTGSPWDAPAGSPVRTTQSVTDSLLAKLGSGIQGGLQNMGASLVAKLTGSGSSGGGMGALAAASPYAAAAQAAGQIAQAAMGGPTTQTSESDGGKIGDGSYGGGDWVVNFSGTLENSHTNPTSNSEEGKPAGINYIFWIGAGLVGLVALRMVAR